VTSPDVTLMLNELSELSRRYPSPTLVRASALLLKLDSHLNVERKLNVALREAVPPLTDGEIKRIFIQCGSTPETFARAIEARHKR